MTLNTKPRAGGTVSAHERARGRDVTDDLDLALVRRMSGGDEEALGDFYDRWHSFVHIVVGRCVIGSDDREDVVEATFWQAWQEAARFEPNRGGVRAWLFAIARSRALDAVRAAGRRREVPLIGDGGEDMSGTFAMDNPALDAEHAERSAALIDALAALPLDQRVALELGYFSGLSQTEIAARLSVPLGTVKTRMRLGLLKLRNTLHALRDAMPGESIHLVS